MQGAGEVDSLGRSRDNDLASSTLNVRTSSFNRRHLASGFNDVFDANRAPVNFGRITLAEEVNSTVLEPECSIFDTQVVCVDGSAVRRVIADGVKEVVNVGSGVVYGDDFEVSFAGRSKKVLTNKVFTLKRGAESSTACRSAQVSIDTITHRYDQSR